MDKTEISSSPANIVQRASAASFIRSALRARRWLSQAIWIWPIVAAILLAVVGFFMRRTIEDSIRQDIASELSTILKAEVAALKLWMQSQQTTAASLAADPTVVRLCSRLVEMGRDKEAAQSNLLASKELKELRAEIEPALKEFGYTDLVIVSKNLHCVGGTRNEAIAQPYPYEDRSLLEQRVFKGLEAVSAPRPSAILLPDKEGKLRAGVPTMFAWAPLRDENGEIIAGLGVRLDPSREFTEILSIGRSGQSGETYAFNDKGVMLSSSRFENELRRMGLIPNSEGAMLQLAIRDPGVNLSKGERRKSATGDGPLTRMAASATAGDSGVDAGGYRDYRGVPVVGAWTWLDEYQMGIATEQDVEEALAPIRLLQWFFWGLLGLLGLAALGIFAVTLFAAKLDRQAKEAALEAKRLGQYTLDEKIGEGAMGVVYRARHAMLHRPTAVKFLDPQKTNDQSVARFEREVQLTSNLTHPNTVTIYDYGRTPEGVFYYAMELLQGITLEHLIDQSGPLGDERVIWILQQACGSLAEAHEAGLIHRDIKPANLMLCTQGGVYDFVKVLDFGLAKAVDTEKQSRLTAAGAIAGTPLYLAPEAIQNPDKVDALSDIYALGAVGYFLLTGQPVFEGRSVMEVLQKHIGTAPIPPSQVVGRVIMPELEALILSCLAKNPSDRPGSTRAMVETLEQLSRLRPWTQPEARLYWVEKNKTTIDMASVAKTMLLTDPNVT